MDESDKLLYSFIAAIVMMIITGILIVRDNRKRKAESMSKLKIAIDNYARVYYDGWELDTQNPPEITWAIQTLKAHRKWKLVEKAIEEIV